MAQPRKEIGMNRRWVALGVTLVVLLALGLLAGCGSSTTKKGEESGTNPPGNVTGESKTVKVGEEFTVELESNASTGYEWKMTQGPDTSILGLTTDEFVAPQTTMPGAPGMHVWRFKALKAGKTNMVFEYARSWETGVPPAQTHSVSVEVQ